MSKKSFIQVHVIDTVIASYMLSGLFSSKLYPWDVGMGILITTSVGIGF